MPLTKAEKRERRRQVNTEQMEYINKYREGDTFYHITYTENALSLLKNGFDPARIGKGAGCQGGPGFAMTWTTMDAEQWGERLYSWGAQGELTVVRVSLPGIKIADLQESEDCIADAIRWGRANGYCKPDVGDDQTFASTEKLKALCIGELANTGWALIGFYLRSIGFDAYMVGIDEIVVTHHELLKPEVFSLVKP